MFNSTRIAALAFAGILAGTAPATAAPPEFTLSNPVVVGQATAQVGMACTKCAAQVACAMVPLYQEISAMIERLTPQSTAPLSAIGAPLYSAAKAASDVLVEIEFKKPDPNR